MASKFYIGELAIGAGIGMLTALGIVYAGPSLLVAGEQAGVEASYCLGANVLTTSVIPDIVASGGGVLLATDGAYILNELNAMNTGENLAVETVFDGDEENYEDFVMVLEMLNQAFGDLTARGYQRTSAENNSSNITQKNKEESSSETGLDIRNANDESSLNSVDDIIKGVENGNTPLSNNIQKGNYGEMKMDAYFESQGYERISLDKVTDLNTPTHQGIDGVYYNPDGHPPYIIGEAKYGSSKLGSTPRDANE